jgi:hypothetical protein
MRWRPLCTGSLADDGLEHVSVKARAVAGVASPAYLVHLDEDRVPVAVERD